jgi:hypothetical protein
MSNRLSQSLYLILAALVVTVGCQRYQQKEQEEVEVLARGPDVAAISAVSDYTNKAIDATGGLETWKRTKELQLDCVVTFYRPDGSVYLTEQGYTLYPWSNVLEISAREPQGTFVWRFAKGQLTVVQGGEQVEKLPMPVATRCFSEAILNIVTAPARLADASEAFTRQDTAVKMHGQWYYTIARKASQGVTEAIFYQDRDNSLIDMIGFACANKDKSLVVRGYDYKEIEKGGIVLPTRMEIFSAAAEADSQQRLVKIDCHAMRLVQ